MLVSSAVESSNPLQGRHVASLQRRAFPSLQEAELPPELPKLSPEADAYACVHNLELLPLLCSLCNAYEALGPLRVGSFPYTHSTSPDLLSTGGRWLLGKACS